MTLLSTAQCEYKAELSNYQTVRKATTVLSLIYLDSRIFDHSKIKTTDTLNGG